MIIVVKLSKALADSELQHNRNEPLQIICLSSSVVSLIAPNNTAPNSLFVQRLWSIYSNFSAFKFSYQATILFPEQDTPE